MPTVKFMGEKVTGGDVLMADMFAANRSRYTDDVLRQLDHLEGFMKANSFPSDVPRARIFGLFSAQWVRLGRNVSTAVKFVDDFVRFGVDPFHIDGARDRVVAMGIGNGLRRYAKSRGRSFIRKLSKEPLPHVLADEPTDAREQELQAFWCLVCITGNRPANVARSAVTETHESYVRVRWNVRKVHSNVLMKYKYAWTATPPQWVLNRWRTLGERPWPFRKPDNVASALNRWLERKGSTLTSSSPRERLDWYLRDQVEQGLMLGALYTRIIDHDYETGLGSYAEGVWVKK